MVSIGLYFYILDLVHSTLKFRTWIRSFPLGPFLLCDPVSSVCYSASTHTRCSHDNWRVALALRIHVRESASCIVGAPWMWALKATGVLDEAGSSEEQRATAWPSFHTELASSSVKSHFKKCNEVSHLPHGNSEGMCLGLFHRLMIHSVSGQLQNSFTFSFFIWTLKIYHHQCLLLQIQFSEWLHGVRNQMTKSFPLNSCVCRPNSYGNEFIKIYS